jgi:PAS domain S-box-containing protein
MKKKTTSPSTSSRPKARPKTSSKKKRLQGGRNPFAEGLLRNDDRALRALIKNSHDIFTLTDAQGKILYRSPTLDRIIKVPEDRIIRTGIFDWVWPEDAEKARKLFAQVLRSPGKGIPFEIRFRDETGSPRWVDGIATNLLEDPAVGALLVNYCDITERKRQQEELAENERKCRELFERAKLAIYQSTPEGKLIRVNPAFARMFGYGSPGELCAAVKDIAADLFVDPDRRGELIRRLAKSPALSGVENLYRRKDGSTFHGSVEIHTVKDSGGRTQYLEGYLEDISDRKRAERALRESEEKFRSIFENSSAGVTLEGLDRRYLLVNPAFCGILGYSAEELLGKDFLEVTHPDDVELSRRAAQEMLDGESKRVRFGKRYRHKDGHTVWADVSAALVSDGEGRPAHFLVSILDMTEHRRTEEALRKSEGKASAIMASAPYGITFVDAQGVITYANPAAERLLDIRQDETGKLTYDDTRWKITAPDGMPFPPEQLPFHRVMASGQAVYDVEHAIERENGERALLSVNSAPLFAPDGTISGMVSAIRDITDQRRAEKALRESEQRYRSLFDNSLEGIGLSQGNRIVDANKALLEMFGYDSLEEMRARPLLDFVAPESKECIRRRLEEIAEGTQKRFVFKAVRRDGEMRDLEISTDHIELGGEIFTHSTFRDISERLRTEEELRSLSRRYEALLAAIPEIVMEVDNRRVYTWANPAGIEFFGPDVVGKEAEHYFEGEQKTYALVQPLFNGGGDTIYVESWQRRKDGRKRLLAWWCRNLKSDRGEVTGALSSARDITEERAAQEEIHILSRFPAENPSPVMRMTPEGVLLFANNASRPLLELWNVGVGQTVPEECRAPVGEAYRNNANREIEFAAGERVFACMLTPIQSAGYVNIYGRDITEGIHSRESLARQAEELRQRNAELARMNERNEHQMRRLIAMRAIDTAITSSFKLELVLNILLGQLTDLLDLPAAEVLIFQADLQTFRLFCGRGFRNPLQQQTFLRKPESYANQAAQLRRIVRVPRLEERTDAAKIYPNIQGEDFRSYLCIPLLAKGAVKGVLEIFSREHFETDPEADSFLELVAGQAAIAIDNAELFEGLQASNDELNLAYNDTLTGWARTLELHERGTAGETQRLADMAVRLAKSLGTPEKDLVPIYRGAILHDIGMMGIPDGILGKSGPLTEEEWTIVRKHPQFARDLLSSVNYLRPAIDIPYCHHEKWDGSGYPRGLAGTQIPWAARIFAVVDVWDALRSDRPQRKAWKDADARAHIHQQSGAHFDPKVAEVFFEVIAGQ